MTITIKISKDEAGNFAVSKSGKHSLFNAYGDAFRYAHALCEELENAGGTAKVAIMPSVSNIERAVGIAFECARLLRAGIIKSISTEDGKLIVDGQVFPIDSKAK